MLFRTLILFLLVIIVSVNCTTQAELEAELAASRQAAQTPQVLIEDSPNILLQDNTPSASDMGAVIEQAIDADENPMATVEVDAADNPIINNNQEKKTKKTTTHNNNNNNNNNVNVAVNGNVEANANTNQANNEANNNNEGNNNNNANNNKENQNNNNNNNNNGAVEGVIQGNAKVNQVTLPAAFNNFFGNNINQLNFQPFQNQATIFAGFAGNFGGFIAPTGQQQTAAGTNGVLNFQSTINTFGGLAYQQPGQGFVQAPTLAQVQGGNLVNAFGGGGIMVPNTPVGGQNNLFNPGFNNPFNPFGSFGVNSQLLNFANSNNNYESYKLVGVFSQTNYMALVIVLAVFCGFFIGSSTYLIYSSSKPSYSTIPPVNYTNNKQIQPLPTNNTQVNTNNGRGSISNTV